MNLLRGATVTVVGVGGLGSAVVPLLAAQGVGKLILVDGDRVELSNLPRQTLFGTNDVGTWKADLAGQRAKMLSPDAQVEVHTERLTMKNVGLLLRSAMVIDCTDNFETQYLLDAATGKHDVPMVWGAAEGYIGQVALLHGRRGLRLCDLFDPPEEEIDLPDGVWPPLVHMVGTVMASEALAFLLGWDCQLDGGLWTVDMRTYDTHHFWVV